IRFRPRFGPNREQPLGDAVRTTNAHFSLPRLEGRRAGILAACEKVAVSANGFRDQLRKSSRVNREAFSSLAARFDQSVADTESQPLPLKAQSLRRQRGSDSGLPQ